MPEYRIDSLAALNAIPINASQPGQGDVTLLANVATVSRTNVAPVISHYNIVPVIDIFGGVSGRDLGGVLHDIQPLIAAAQAELPRGSLITLARPGRDHAIQLYRLGIGLGMAIMLIYLLLVVNFQSWLDPFIIITALPGPWPGVVWALAFDPDHGQRAGPDGRHHEHGRGHRKFRAGSDLRPDPLDQGWTRWPPPGRRASAACAQC